MNDIGNIIIEIEELKKKYDYFADLYINMLE